MIANVSPTSLCYSDTLSTLKLAQKTILINNHAKLNQEIKEAVKSIEYDSSQNESIPKNLDENKYITLMPLQSKMVFEEIENF